MKITIVKSKDNLATLQFGSDSLYNYYDFAKNEDGEVIFDNNMIYNLLHKRLTSSDEIKTAEKLIEFVKELPINEEKNYNFLISNVRGRITIEVGYRLKEIKEHLDDYVMYLKELGNGFETRIEFELE